MIIIYDLDDVLCECVEGICAWYNETYPEHPAVTPATFRGWDMSRFTPIGAEIYTYFDTNFYLTTRPTVGAAGLLRATKEAGHTNVIATSTFHQEGAKAFVDKYFNSLYDMFIYTKKKSDVEGDYIFDDKPENLLGGTWKPYLYTRYHNLDETRFPRVASMDEIATVLGVVIKE